MALEITDRGLQAIARADAGGFLINLTSFAVSEKEVVANKTVGALVGTPVYKGKINSMQVRSNSTVEFEIKIPVGVPAAGSWELKEIGLFLDDGTLFAHGSLDPAYEKSAEFGIKVKAFVVAARLGDVINITVANEVSLPTVAHVYQLPNPEDAEFNMVVVQDGQYNPDRTSSSVVASKYGSGGQYWAFEGYDRIYRGVVDSVYKDHLGFTLVTNIRGFVVSVGELLIAQSVYGTGAGQSRRIRYIGNNEFEEVDGQPFNIDTTTLIVLWKSNSSNRVAALLKPSVVTAQFVADGATKEFTLPTTPNDANYVLPFVAGQPVTGYSLIENQTKIALSSTPLNGDVVDIAVVQLLSDVSNTGQIFKWEHLEFTGNGATREWPVGFTPEDVNHVFFYVDGKLLKRNSEYNIGPDKVKTTVAVANGKKIRIAILKLVNSQNNNLVIRRHIKSVSNATSVRIYQDAESDSLGSILVNVNGLEVSDDQWFVPDGKILQFTALTTGTIEVVELRPSVQFLSNSSPFNTAEIVGKTIKMTRLDGQRVELPLPKESVLVIPEGLEYGPGAFPENQMTAWDAYNSPDMPQVVDSKYNTGKRYWSGITSLLTSFAAPETSSFRNRGFQLAVCWNAELDGPEAFAIRIKDDTKNSFGAWRQIAFKDEIFYPTGQAVITTSQNFVAPVSGYYNVKVVGAGSAGWPAVWSNNGTVDTKVNGRAGEAGEVVEIRQYLHAGDVVPCIIGNGGVDPTSSWHASTSYYQSPYFGPYYTEATLPASENGGFSSFGSYATALGGRFNDNKTTGQNPTVNGGFGFGGNGGVANVANMLPDAGSRGGNGAIIITWSLT